MKNYKIALLILWFIPAPLFSQSTVHMKNSLVKVIVHKQEMDVHEPWKNGRVYTEEHVGTVVSFNNKHEKGILVKATALSFAKRIEMQLVSGTELIELTPTFIDNEINLALLETSTSEILDTLRPLSVYDEEVPIEEEVHLYRIENTNQIARIPSTLRKVVYGERIDISSYPTINYVFKVPRKEIGWSEPILSKGRIVALAMGEDEDENVHAIPSTAIAHFLNDDLNEGYEGFPFSGIHYTSLSSPHTREALGLEKLSHGVLIHDVNKQSAFYSQVQKGDVLLSMDGKKINFNGNINHPLWGEISAGSLLYKYYAGEKMSIEVIKDKTVQKITAKLNRYNSNLNLIPYSQNGKVAFLIMGGLVFQELTRPYLRAWGKNWMGDAPSALTYFWRFKNIIPDDPSQKVIILNQILADPINKGYDGISNALVKSVNKQQIHSISDLVNALKNPISKNNENFSLVQLEYGDGEVIIPMNEIDSANSRIANNYGIYERDVFFASTTKKRQNLSHNIPER